MEGAIVGWRDEASETFFGAAGLANGIRSPLNPHLSHICHLNWIAAETYLDRNGGDCVSLDAAEVTRDWHVVEHSPQDHVARAQWVHFK